MAWIRSHLGLIGIALLIAAAATGLAAINGTAASGLPFPFVIAFVVVLVAGFVLDRAARNASSGR
jgi:FtsH-binding integral membrane protein